MRNGASECTSTANRYAVAKPNLPACRRMLAAKQLERAVTHCSALRKREARHLWNLLVCKINFHSGLTVIIRLPVRISNQNHCRKVFLPRILLVPVLIDRICHFDQPRSVFDQFQQFRRSKKLDTILCRITQGFEQTRCNQNRHIMRLAIQNPRRLFRIQAAPEFGRVSAGIDFAPRSCVLLYRSFNPRTPGRFCRRLQSVCVRHCVTPLAITPTLALVHGYQPCRPQRCPRFLFTEKFRQLD